MSPLECLDFGAVVFLSALMSGSPGVLLRCISLASLTFFLDSRLGVCSTTAAS